MFIREHCFAKKLLNISAFSLKFVITPLCNIGRIHGIYLLFKNAFNTDQSDFNPVMRSDNFLDKQA